MSTITELQREMEATIDGAVQSKVDAVLALLAEEEAPIRGRILFGIYRVYHDCGNKLDEGGYCPSSSCR